MFNDNNFYITKIVHVNKSCHIISHLIISHQIDGRTYRRPHNLFETIKFNLVSLPLRAPIRYPFIHGMAKAAESIAASPAHILHHNCPAIIMSCLGRFQIWKLKKRQIACLLERHHESPSFGFSCVVVVASLSDQHDVESLPRCACLV